MTIERKASYLYFTQPTSHQHWRRASRTDCMALLQERCDSRRLLVMAKIWSRGPGVVGVGVAESRSRTTRGRTRYISKVTRKSNVVEDAVGERSGGVAGPAAPGRDGVRFSSSGRSDEWRIHGLRMDDWTTECRLCRSSAGKHERSSWRCMRAACERESGPVWTRSGFDQSRVSVVVLLVYLVGMYRCAHFA